MFANTQCVCVGVHVRVCVHVCVRVCMCVCVCKYMRVYTHTANDIVCKHVLCAFAVHIHIYLFAIYIYLQCIFICNLYLPCVHMHRCIVFAACVSIRKYTYAYGTCNMSVLCV